MSTPSTPKKKQLIRVGIILLIIAMIITYNYTDIKAGFIEGWNAR